MIFNKQLVLLLTAGLFAMTLSAQSDNDKRRSPPAQVSNTIENLTLAIAYSQPAVKNRTIWGVLVPYGKVWRTGANEATTFEVSQDVLIEGQKLAAGKYALFSIPTEKEWTLIFNAEPNQWGAYNYNADKDVLRIKANPKKQEELTERLIFRIDEKGTKEAEVILTWEKLAVSFLVKTAK